MNFNKYPIAISRVLFILHEALAIAETKGEGAFVLPGIGKFVLVKRKTRTGQNPATGEAIKTPAKTVVKIRTAKAFKDAIVHPKK